MQARSASATKHLLILAVIAAVTLLLRFDPAWALHNGPSCIFHAVTHYNCPFCGMTRDFTAMLHGQRPHLNPFSLPFAIALYVLYPLSFLWAWSRQKLEVFHQPAVHNVFAVVLVLMFLANNSFHLAATHLFH